MTTTEVQRPERMTLFQINDAILAVVDRFEDEEGGEVNVEEIAEQLNQLEGKLEEKVAGCIVYLRGQEAMSNAILTEAERLQARSVVHSNRAKRMKEALRFVLESQHRTKIETERGMVTIAGNGGEQGVEAVPLTDEVRALVEPRFVKVTYEWNNKAIREALKAGEQLSVTLHGTEIEIAKLKPRGSHVKVK